MKKALIGSLMMLSAIFGANSAGAVTIDEYNNVDRDTQSGAIAHIVIGTHNVLAQNGASTEKLQCIREYFTAREVQIGSQTVTRVPGIESILDQIDLANQNNELSIRIEDIVLGVINKQCDGVDVADTQDAPVTTPPEPVPTPG